MLSPRETQVLQLISESRSALEIGELLSISYTTAETHARNIRKKLGVSNSAGAVGKAIRLGLISGQMPAHAE